MGGGGRGPGAPLAPRFPAGSPGWQEVGTAEGGGNQAPQAGQKGGAGTKLPTGYCLGSAPSSRRRGHPQGPDDRPLTPEPWELWPGSFPAHVCRVRGLGLPRPAGPSVSSGRLLPPSPGPSFLQQEEDCAPAGSPPRAPGGIWRDSDGATCPCVYARRAHLPEPWFPAAESQAVRARGGPCTPAGVRAPVPHPHHSHPHQEGPARERSTHSWACDLYGSLDAMLGEDQHGGSDRGTGKPQPPSA